MTHLTVLTKEELNAVHQATLRILGEVGVVLREPVAVRMLTDAGATFRDGRIFIPADLVERAIAQCPPTAAIKGRSGITVTLGDGTLHWHNLGGARDVYEPRSGTIRRAILADVSDSARLLDALISVTTVTPFFTPINVPGPLMALSMYRHTLPHTLKPVQGPGVQTAQETRLAIEMASVIGLPSEVLTLGISPVSPLIFPDDVVEAMLETAHHKVTLGPLPCPTSGATAPMSLAGSLAQQNAEILASIVIAQLAQPGLPIVYTGRLAMMEPRTGLSVWGGVELGLVSAATVQLGHRYGLPVNVYGLSTNANDLSFQNGYERALNAAIPALAGADELSGIGEMQAGVAGSFAQMVCDDEIARSVARLRRGFAVDEDALAVEVIASVMAGSRNYLGQRHTKNYLRSGEIFITDLAERGSWEDWDRRGRAGMAEHAQDKAERLLQEHHPAPLSDQQEKELDRIMQAAAEILGTA
jgi:trimethylamine---corrinoid protein Co-methyltransferase